MCSRFLLFAPLSSIHTHGRCSGGMPCSSAAGPSKQAMSHEGDVRAHLVLLRWPNSHSQHCLCGGQRQLVKLWPSYVEGMGLQISLSAALLGFT